MGIPSRTVRGTLATVVVAFCVVVLCACHRSTDGEPQLPPPPAPPPRPNIVLVSIDTLRPDHLGAYGYHRQTSPVLDNLAEKSIVYENAFAPAAWTLPSHAGMLTGRHPYDLNIRNKDSSLPEQVPIISEVLAAAGYQTAGFVDSKKDGYLGVERGFAKGYDEYYHAPFREGLRFKYDMAVTVERANEWLSRRQPDRPFFLFLHTKSVHALPPRTPCIDHRCFPYDKLEPYRFRFIADERVPWTFSSEELGSGQKYLWSLNRSYLSGAQDPRSFPEEQAAALEAMYDAGIYYTDEQIGVLLKRLRELGFESNTVVIITSDHGEAFLEHRFFMHVEVFREVLRVPLIVSLPACERRYDIPAPVSLTDIVPTILEMAGLEPAEDLEGRVLPRDPAEAGGDRLFFAYFLFAKKFDYKAFTVFDDRLKLVSHNLPYGDDLHSEFYDLVQDPEEQYPLLRTPERGSALRSVLEARMGREARHSGPEVLVPEEDLESLRMLGYVD